MARQAAKIRRAKDELLQIRMSRSAKRMIAAAAELAGTSMSEFVTRASRRAAEEEFLSRRLFVLAPAAFEALAALLDRPPALSRGARRRLSRRPVWARA